MNLEKLSPAPWKMDVGAIQTDPYDTPYDWYFARGPIIKGKIAKEGKEAANTDAEFIALARNAFEVMMKREWHAEKTNDGWEVIGSGHAEIIDSRHPDPFTAIVEADKWYRENVEVV